MGFCWNSSLFDEVASGLPNLSYNLLIIHLNLEHHFFNRGFNSLIVNPMEPYKYQPMNFEHEEYILLSALALLRDQRPDIHRSPREVYSAIQD